MPVTSPEISAYLKRPYARLLIPNEDGTFSAEVLEFTGCFAQGDTAKEAVDNLNAAASEWIEAALAKGMEIPEPSTTRGYSGTISLRLPRAIHRQATRMAERDGVSLNQYLVTAIAARVGAEDIFNRMLKRLQQPVRVAAAVVFSLVTPDKKIDLPAEMFTAMASNSPVAIAIGAEKS